MGLLAGIAVVAFIFIGFWFIIKLIIAFYIGCLIFLGISSAVENISDKIRRG